MDRNATANTAHSIAARRKKHEIISQYNFNFADTFGRKHIITAYTSR